VGVGTAPAAVPAAGAVFAVGASFGWVCRCQASQSMISEKLNTNNRINRRLSITFSAVVQVKKSWDRVESARMQRMTTS
jgi:hypothetical protein